MLSEEIKEAVGKLVQEQMSDYCECTNATVAGLMKENKKLEELIHEINVGLDERIKNVLSGMPRNFWKKIFEMDLQKTEVADTSQAELSFPNDWSREENDSLEEEDGPYKTAVDFNDTKFQKTQEESPESNIRKDAKIQKENERKCKIVHELNNEANQPMSLEAGLLLVQTSEVKGYQKEIVRPKNDSNQPMSLEAGLLLVEASKVKNDPKEIVDPKNDSNQPMSLEAGLLLVEASKVKNDPKEIVDLKNDSNQPMSLETSYEVYASKDAHCSRHDVKVGSSSETLVFSEADLNTKKEFSEERPVSGECTGAKGKIDLQASGIKQEKKESSKRQESSKSGKMKNPFLQFKKKGNTNH